MGSPFGSMRRTGSNEESITGESYGAEFFSDLAADRYYPFYVRLAEMLSGLCSAARVLDVGCGLGYLVNAFHDRGVEADGIDYSEYALASSPAEIRDRLWKVDLESDASWPFPDNHFDLVTSLNTFEHLSHPEAAISEMSRTLRSEGRVFLSVPSPISNELSALVRRYREPTHVSVLPKATWVKLFEANALTYERRLDISGAFMAIHYRSTVKRALMRCPLARLYGKLPHNLVFRKAGA